MSHGISVSVAFKLRHERNPERMRALLDLSSSSLGILHGSIGVLLLTGLLSDCPGRWWGRGWIWLSLGLLITIYFYMGIAGSGYLQPGAQGSRAGVHGRLQVALTD